MSFVSNVLLSIEKSNATPFDPVSFISTFVKSLNTLPDQKKTRS